MPLDQAGLLEYFLPMYNREYKGYSVMENMTIGVYWKRCIERIADHSIKEKKVICNLQMRESMAQCIVIAKFVNKCKFEVEDVTVWSELNRKKH